MTIHDITTREYESVGGYSGLATNVGYQERKFTGAELKTLKDGTVPADGDSFKICPIPKGSYVSKTRLAVVDPDATSIVVETGYTDGTNTDDNAFETDGNLNSKAVTDSEIATKCFPNSAGYLLDPFLTMTLADIASNLEDDTEFYIGWWIELQAQAMAESLTAPF